MVTLRQILTHRVEALQHELQGLEELEARYVAHPSFVQQVSDFFTFGENADNAAALRHLLDQSRREIRSLQADLAGNHLNEVALHLNTSYQHLLEAQKLWNRYTELTQNGAERAQVGIALTCATGGVGGGFAVALEVGVGILAAFVGGAGTVALASGGLQPEETAPSPSRYARQIEQARRLLINYSRHRRDPSFDYGRFFLETQYLANLPQLPAGQNFTFSSDFDQILARIRPAPGLTSLERRNQIIIQLFLNSSIDSYERDNPYMRGFLFPPALGIPIGGACQANSQFMVATLHRQHADVPGETRALNLFADHIQPVSLQGDTSFNTNLMSGEENTEIQAPTYAEEIFAYAFLLSQGIVPPIEEEALLLAPCRLPHQGDVPLEVSHTPRGELFWLPYSARLFNPTGRLPPERTRLSIPDFINGAGNSEAPETPPYPTLLVSELEENGNLYRKIMEKLSFPILPLLDEQRRPIQGWVFLNKGERRTFLGLYNPRSQEHSLLIRHRTEQALQGLFSPGFQTFLRILQNPEQLRHLSQENYMDLWNTMDFLTTDSHQYPFQGSILGMMARWSDQNFRNLPPLYPIYEQRLREIKQAIDSFYSHFRQNPGEFFRILDSIPLREKNRILGFFLEDMSSLARHHLNEFRSALEIYFNGLDYRRPLRNPPPLTNHFPTEPSPSGLQVFLVDGSRLNDPRFVRMETYVVYLLFSHGSHWRDWTPALAEKLRQLCREYPRLEDSFINFWNPLVSTIQLELQENGADPDKVYAYRLLLPLAREIAAREGREPFVVPNL